jgi:DNA polymerase-3 subunit delta'
MDNTDHFETHVVVGHDWAIDLLTRQQQRGQMPQALLLAGPRHVGKSTLGRFLVQSLNCQGSPRPCGQCLSCRKIISGNHPDVRIFDSDDDAIKIEQIRALQRELSLSPHESQYRAALLCNFERATTSAANALLKTLEEPAEQVVLILTVIDPSRLLPTIVSRCQMVTLRALSGQQIFEALQTKWQASPEQAELLAQLAAGRLGWAIRALEDKNFLERREHRLHELLELLRMSRAERLAYAQSLSRDYNTIKETLALWLTIWRDLLLLQSDSQTRLTNLDWQEALQTIARQTSIAQAKAMVARLRTALINLEYNVNPRLNLEVVLLKLPMM